jgi:hypothetical protein
VGSVPTIGFEEEFLLLDPVTGRLVLAEAGDRQAVDLGLRLLDERGTGADRQLRAWLLDPARAVFTRALARTTLTAHASVRHRDVTTFDGWAALPRNGIATSGMDR